MANSDNSGQGRKRPVKIIKKPKTGKKNYYFINELVEELLTEYVKGGCIKLELRDKIMSHASELIRQMIRAQNLHNIYPGQDEASFGDLEQIAWCQIESALYKFNYAPGHTKVFNMWSQIAKTVILAHIKKESRDRKNSGGYRKHVGNKIGETPKLDRFMGEAQTICKYNEEGLKILEAIEKIYRTDSRAHEGLVGKLAGESGLSKQQVSAFLKQLRLMSHEFTDATIQEVSNDSLRFAQEAKNDGYNSD